MFASAIWERDGVGRQFGVAIWCGVERVGSVLVREGALKAGEL